MDPETEQCVEGGLLNFMYLKYVSKIKIPF